MALSVIKTKTLSHPARQRQDLPASNATKMCSKALGPPGAEHQLNSGVLPQGRGPLRKRVKIFVILRAQDKPLNLSKQASGGGGEGGQP